MICASKSRVIRWMRAASIIARPTTISSRRRSEPIVPARTRPELIPTPMSKAGRPSAAQRRGERAATAATMSSRGPHRPQGDVGARLRHAEQRDDLVADQLLHRALVAEDDVDHLGEVLVEEPDHHRAPGWTR